MVLKFLKPYITDLTNFDQPKGSWMLASFLPIKDQKMSKWTLAELNELWMSNQKCITWTGFSCKPIRFSWTGLILILLRWNNVDPTNAISQIQPKSQTSTHCSCKPIRFSWTGLILILLRWNNVNPTNAIAQIQPKIPNFDSLFM